MTIRRTLTIGRQRFRIGTWHADPATAQITLTAKGPPPSAEDVRECISQVVELGFRSMITSAIEAAEVPGFLGAGFSERDRLKVLAHDLGHLPEPDGERSPALRRGRRQDRRACVDLDNEAFPATWRIDGNGLADARSATPSSRFRVATLERRVVGYAITGRATHQGFLQRLAVDPHRWRRGVGTALVLDALRWCGRHKCRSVFVNTQASNRAALCLYEQLGFRDTLSDMVVLEWRPT